MRRDSEEHQTDTQPAATVGELRQPVAPQLPILETDYVNTPLPHQVGNWASAAVGGNEWMTVGGPPYGWTNLHDPHQQYDVPLTAVSGTVVQEPHVSDADMPFLHPFHFDFEFHLAPDKQYFDLVPPGGDDSYVESTKRAHEQFGLNVPGVLGMEIESGLVPPAYRAEFGDRACLFGRWIVDSGHSDFHAEIHPPMIMVSAQQALSTQQVGQNPAKGDATKVRIITRPYLVSQEFEDGHALFDHLLEEVAKVEGGMSLELEANAMLMPQPFVGQNIATFTVRPPTPRENSWDTLVISFQFTRRSSRGVGIQVIPARDNNSVTVVIVLNGNNYDPPPEPHRVPRHVKQAEMDKLDEFAGNVNRVAFWANALFNPVAAWIISKGIQMHRYADLAAPILDHPTTVQLKDVGPVPARVDDTQPFPIAGFMTVEWERRTAPLKL